MSTGQQSIGSIVPNGASRWLDSQRGVCSSKGSLCSQDIVRQALSPDTDLIQKVHCALLCPGLAWVAPPSTCRANTIFLSLSIWMHGNTSLAARNCFGSDGSEMNKGSCHLGWLLLLNNLSWFARLKVSSYARPSPRRSLTQDFKSLKF